MTALVFLGFYFYNIEKQGEVKVKIFWDIQDITMQCVALAHRHTLLTDRYGPDLATIKRIFYKLG